MVKFFRNLIIISLATLACHSASAKSQLKVPRFVTVKSSEANMRSGPDVRYPIKWVYVKKHEPVEVIAEFEHWRKIRDRQNDEGWIHESMLSGKRYGIITAPHSLLVHKKADLKSNGVYWVEPEVRVALLACNEQWCKVQASGMKGWLERKHLWGIYNNESIK